MATTSTRLALLAGAVALSHSFFSVLNDGQFGLYNESGTGTFESLLMQTDDPALTPALPLVSVDDITVVEGGAPGQVVVTVTSEDQS